jgi:hypothetical protein
MSRQKKVKEHQALEKKLLEEMEAARVEVLGLIARNGVRRAFHPSV